MMEENQRKEYHTADSIILPILPTRGFVVYPGQNVNFEVFRPQSLRALERAMSLGTMAFLGIQKNEMTENPEQDDLWDIVVSMKIEKVFKEQKDVRVLGLIGKRYRQLARHYSCDSETARSVYRLIEEALETVAGACNH